MKVKTCRAVAEKVDKSQTHYSGMPPNIRRTSTDPKERVMIEPVELANFLTVFFSAASVIVFGAVYALLFAYARIHRRPRLMPLTYAAYLALFASVLTLAFAANLFSNGFWTFVVLLMLGGYLVAPHAIWHLCVGTHAGGHDDTSAAAPVKISQQR